MKVFIDGAEGTTGLQLEERLTTLNNIEILNIDSELRKNSAERKKLLNSADVAFLCLPDNAAREAVEMVENPDTVIIDASTAHRTAPDWTYGFPELSEDHLKDVRTSKRIAVPGCHASGFCSIVYPLVKNGMIEKEQILSCTSLTGYSGGGKSMISEYESKTVKGARPYALSLKHKHLPEMRHVCGLENPPIFQPIVVPVRQGMLVSVPLSLDASTVWEYLKDYYAKAENVSVVPFGGENMLDAGFMDMEALNGTDKLEIFIFGHETQTLAVARLDNLGKGAAGAAMQLLNILNK